MLASATATSRFAFASTIGIYVYDSHTYQLNKLLTYVDHNISAIAWEPKLERYLAHASMDKKLLIWDLETESIKYEIDLSSHVIHIAWNESDINLIYLL